MLSVSRFTFLIPGVHPMKFGRQAALAAMLLTVTAFAVNFGGAVGQDKKEQPKEKKGFKQKSWDEVADSAVAYLKTTQADDGTWSKTSHPGVTAVVLTGLFKSGKVKA